MFEENRHFRIETRMNSLAPLVVESAACGCGGTIFFLLQNSRPPSYLKAQAQGDSPPFDDREEGSIAGS
jgi:hypothetical protein